MGMTVGTLLQLFGASMRSVALSDEYSFAVQVAESRLAAVGSEIPVKPGDVAGEEKGSAYRWRVQMEPIEPDEKMEKLSVPLQLYGVEVVVTWKSGDKPREFHLSSLRFGEKP